MIRFISENELLEVKDNHDSKQVLKLDNRVNLSVFCKSHSYYFGLKDLSGKSLCIKGSKNEISNITYLLCNLQLTNIYSLEKYIKRKNLITKLDRLSPCQPS
jgi:hypothetical protein